MKRLAPILAWLIVLGLGAFLRLDALGDRPFHADEATGAKITAQRLDAEGYLFDPVHYHGPLLSALGATAARLAGESDWSALTKVPLRLVPCLAGCLLVALPLLGARRFGQAPMLLAALALAVSPISVYYSRMYIHEMLLVLFGLLALSQFGQARRSWLVGLGIGLMFATKETFVISLLAWGLAAILTFWQDQATWSLSKWKTFRKPVGIAVGLALATSMAFYTNGFTQWRGALDAFRTYFVYETVDGHDKPFGYYFHLLIQPKHAGGAWWSELAILIPAAAAVIVSFASGSISAHTRRAIHFLAWSAAFHFLIYGLIAYKTPWLALLPWAHVCLLAGFAMCLPSRHRPRATLAAGVAAIGGVATLIPQARLSTGRYASDERNPYAYVPSSGDLESLPRWVRLLDEADPDLAIEPLALIGENYWPLPWYLRQFQYGVWAQTPPHLAELPMIFALEDLTESLSPTHVPIPRGLRADTPMMAWIRQDLWDASFPPEEP